MGDRAIAFAVLLLLGVATVQAGVPAVLSVEKISYAYTSSVTMRTWSPSSVCAAWNNASDPVCATWDNSSKWSCAGTATYFYRSASMSHSVSEKTSAGFASNVSVSGLWSLNDAGNKVIAGVNGFNVAYCFNGGNITAGDRDDVLDELNAINLTELKGRRLKPVPAPVGASFGFTGETEAVRGGTKATWRAGNHSLDLTYTSSADFDGGTKWNTTTGVVANSITLEQYTGAGSLSETDPSGRITINNGTSNVSFIGVDRNETSYVAENTTLWANNDQLGNYSFDLMVNDGTTNGLVGVGFRDTENQCYANTAYFMSMEAVPATSSVGFNTNRFRAGGFVQGTALQLGNMNQQFWVTLDATGGNFRARVWNDSGRSILLGTSTVALFGERMNSAMLFCSFNSGNVNMRVTGWVRNHTLNNTDLYGSLYYARNGSWSSTVMDAGTSQARWINWTNTSTMAGGDGMSWQMRSSNTSFAQNDTTPAWTPLGNASSGVNTLENHSRYAQFNASLWSNSDTITPQLDAFIVNYTLLPYYDNTGATGNVTYAAPGQPVLVGIDYTDAESGQARLSLNNSTPTGGVFCENYTLATGNSTAYCAFTWNHTADNSAPSFCGLLTDEDGAGNWTNCSAPVTTDNAAPTVTADSIANTSTGSFALNIYRADSASGMNQTRFSIFNLSNNSAGDTPLTNYSNTTLWSNDTISLCQGAAGRPACMGQIRVAASGDDAVGTSPTDGYRHWSGYSNQSFWFDPPPVLTNASRTGCGNVYQGCNVWGDVVENLTSVGAATARIRSPSGGYAEESMSLDSGSATDGVWRAGFTLNALFPGEDTGTYEIQVAVRDVSTSDYATAANITFSFGVAGGDGGPRAAGAPGGPAPISVFAPPPPAAGVAAVPTQGLACPPEIRQVHYITPYDRGTSRWSMTCRTLSGFEATGCAAVGEKVAPNGTLAGEADPWWSCQAIGGDRVQITYTIPQAQISDEMFLRVFPTKQLAWNTFARVRAESGQNVTSLDVRLRVSNFWAAPLRVPIPFPLSSVVSALTPLAPATLLLSAAMAFGAWYRRMGNLAWLWYVGAGLLAVFGLGSVIQVSGGSVVQGILLVWVLYGGVSVFVWGSVLLDAFQKARELKARLAKG